MTEVYCDPLLSDYAADRDSGRLVGDVGFGEFAPTGDVELGYTLARRCRGLGDATAAARACLAKGLRHLDRPRIIAAIDLQL